MRIALGVSLALHLVAAVSVKLFWNGNGSGTKPVEPNMAVAFSEETAVANAVAVAPMERPLVVPPPISGPKVNPQAPAVEPAPVSKIPESVSAPPPRPALHSEVSTAAVMDSKVVAAAGGSSRTEGPALSPRAGEGAKVSPPAAAVEQATGNVQSKGALGVLARPVYRRNPEPAYPAAARRRRQEGVTLLAVSVSASGRALRVAVKKSSGYQLLDEAAVGAVVDWEFEPARAGAVAVESEIEVPVRFVLKQ